MEKRSRKVLDRPKPAAHRGLFCMNTMRCLVLNDKRITGQTTDLTAREDACLK